MKFKFKEKRFVIAADPTGFPLKEILKKHYIKAGYDISDVGTIDADNPVAYYVAGGNAAKHVKEGKSEFGIVICGSGMGVCMAANRFPGIYCAVCESIHTAQLSRIINNANILALGGNIVAPDLAINMVDAFIKTSFVEGIEGETQDFLVDAIGHLGELEKEAAQLAIK